MPFNRLAKYTHTHTQISILFPLLFYAHFKRFVSNEIPLYDKTTALDTNKKRKQNPLKPNESIFVE